MFSEARQQYWSGDISLVYLLRGLRNLLFIMPILVVFYQSNGLDLKQVFLLQSTFSLTSILLEIPTGYYSDRMGRKAALIVGGVATCLGFLFYSISHGFWSFLLSEMLLGVGTSFVSGTDVALLQESLASQGRVNEYGKAMGRLFAVGNVAEGIASLTSGVLAARALRAPFYLQVGVAVLALMVSMFLKSAVNSQLSQSVRRRPTLLQATSGTLRGDAYLSWLIYASALCHIATISMVWLLQPCLQKLGMSLQWFGLIWACLQFVFGLFSLIAFKVVEATGPMKMLKWLLCLLPASYLVMGLNFGPITLSLAMFFFIARGLMGPTLTTLISERVPSERKATALSMQSLANRVSFAVVGPVLGWVSDAYSLPITLSFLGVFGLIMAVVFCLRARSEVVLVRAEA